MDDAKLLRAYRDGDEQAFEKLVDRYLGLVHGVARRRLGDVTLAEEVAQNVFVTLAKKAQAGMECRGRLANWLHTAAVKHASTALRSERRRLKRLQQVEVAESPMKTSDHHDMLAELDRALSKLSDGDRDAIWMRFLEERSYGEMAATLGKSEDAAQKQTSRALEKLSAIMRRRLGTTVTTVSLAGCLSVEFMRAAPSGLNVRIMRAVIPLSVPAGSWTGFAYLSQGALTLKASLLGASMVIGSAAFYWQTVTQNSPSGSEALSVASIQSPPSISDQLKRKRRSGARSVSTDDYRGMTAVEMIELFARSVLRNDPTLTADLEAHLAKLDTEAALTLLEEVIQLSAEGVSKKRFQQALISPIERKTPREGVMWAAMSPSRSPFMVECLRSWCRQDVDDALAWLEDSQHLLARHAISFHELVSLEAPYAAAVAHAVETFVHRDTAKATSWALAQEHEAFVGATTAIGLSLVRIRDDEVVWDYVKQVGQERTPNEIAATWWALVHGAIRSPSLLKHFEIIHAKLRESSQVDSAKDDLLMRMALGAEEIMEWVGANDVDVHRSGGEFEILSDWVANESDPNRRALNCQRFAEAWHPWAPKEVEAWKKTLP